MENPLCLERQSVGEPQLACRRRKASIRILLGTSACVCTLSVGVVLASTNPSVFDSAIVR